ncbi:MAG TPA: hypothetical protein VL128_08850 [Candidatus Eisenbacteria bacterium]|nr:hypothetical protein [Candidatus Eisenbacteria bacterium]
MPDAIAAAIWIVGMGAGVSFVVVSLVRGSFLKYFFLNLYVIFSMTADLLRQYVLRSFGLDSTQYHYVYYYTDCLLTIALFVAVISLASRVFAELNLDKFVRVLAVLLLLGTAGFSYAVVAQSTERLSTSFTTELSQNLYFVGLVLTYLLWGAVLKLQETRTRLVQMVLSLGLYFSAYAGSYALLNLASKYQVVQYLGPLLGCFLPISWSLTMLRHTEEARLTPARLVAVQR